MQEYVYDGELTHHGILGMKWGIRRFQNKDGSLTKAGQKRRNPNESSSNVKKKVVKKPEVKEEKNKPKKISEMSDDELKTTINRMQLEKQGYELQKSIATLNPRKVSAGEKFAKSLLDDVVAPAAKNAGKMYLEKMLKDKLGLSENESKNNEKALDALRKEVTTLNLKKQRVELKKYFEEEKKEQK